MADRRVRDPRGGSAGALRISSGGREVIVSVRHGRFLRFTVRPDQAATTVFDPAEKREVAVHLARYLTPTGSMRPIEIDGESIDAFMAHRITGDPIEREIKEEGNVRLVPTVRDGPAVPAERVFGSPSSPMELTRWLSSVPTSADARGPVLGEREAPWEPTEVVGVDSVHRFLSYVAASVDPVSALRVLAGAVAISQPVLLGPQLVSELFESEDLPEEWLSDIRVPLRPLTILFGDDFLLPRWWSLGFPEATESSPDVMVYRSVLQDGREGLAWLGVTLFGESDYRLASNAAAICRTTTATPQTYGVVPVDMRVARLTPQIRSLAAYVSALRPVRMATEGGRRASSRPRTPIRCGWWPTATSG
jgi:hypothetical protein